MKTMLILTASALILVGAGANTARADDEVIEHRVITEDTHTGEPVVIEKRTTVIEQKEGTDVDIDVGGGGILSTTVDLTGEVLALPFKLVGGVFDLVF
jgi:hypothetical protein